MQHDERTHLSGTLKVPHRYPFLGIISHEYLRHLNWVGKLEYKMVILLPSYSAKRTGWGCSATKNFSHISARKSVSALSHMWLVLDKSLSLRSWRNGQDFWLTIINQCCASQLEQGGCSILLFLKENETTALCCHESLMVGWALMLQDKCLKNHSMLNASCMA